MKKRISARLIAVLLLMSLFTGLFPSLTVKAEAEEGLTLEELMEKFPHGKYWNGGDADSWTDTPCTHHGNCPYTGGCGCNSFMGLSIQCMGFAEKLGYDATTFTPRENANGWYTYYSSSRLNYLKAGDIVRIDSASGYGHSIYVTAVEGNTVTYADCNSKNRSCNIRWGATTTISYLKSVFQYVRVAPQELVTGYTGRCTQYPSSGSAVLITACEAMSHPCTAEVYADAVCVAELSAGTALQVTGLYCNTEGVYYYQTQYGEENCYFPAESVEFTPDQGEISVTDISAPANTRKGKGFPIKGNISAQPLKLCRINAYVFSGSDIHSQPVISSDSGQIDTHTYSVYGSDVDDNLTFGSLPAGDFTYLLTATVENCYIKDGGLVEESDTVRLHQNSFTVTSGYLSCSHSFSSGVTQAATCGEDGVITYTCTDCDFSYTQTIFATGDHTMGEWVLIEAPTCTREGYETRSCQNCLLTYVNTLPAAGHREVVTEGQAATCTQSGISQGSYCEVCQTVLIEPTVIPALAHDEEKTYVLPTCTQEGYTVCTCRRCGESNNEDYVAPLGHSYGSWQVTKAATDYCSGEQQKSCTRCGDVVCEEIPAGKNPVSQIGVVLDDRIGMRFILNVEQEDQVAFSLEDTALPATATVNADGSTTFLVSLAAAQITDRIYIQINGEQLEKSYCVMEYASQIRAGDYTEEEKKMVESMLCYGAAAQRFFSYHTDCPADADISANPASVPETGGSLKIRGGLATADFHGATLLFRSNIGIRFYFKAESVADLSFRVGDTVLQPMGEAGLYYVQIDGILPQNLDEAVTVEVTDGTYTLRATYSPMDYIIRTYYKETSSQAMKNLVQALYTYHLAAKSLVAAG